MENQNKSIEKEVFEKTTHSELFEQLTEDANGTLQTQILDAELDAVNCTFNNDGCVYIDTKKLTYITLTQDNLTSLLSLIRQTEAIYEKKQLKLQINEQSN